MQQASHSSEAQAGPGPQQDVKAVVADWLDRDFLPAINAQVGMPAKLWRHVAKLGRPRLLNWAMLCMKCDVRAQEFHQQERLG